MSELNTHAQSMTNAERKQIAIDYLKSIDSGTEFSHLFDEKSD